MPVSAVELRNPRLLSGWPERVVQCEELLVLRLDPDRLHTLQMRRRLVQGAPLGLTVGSGWRIECAIGSGGSATVFRARNSNGELAAVKLMHHQLASAWTKRFEREAKLLQSLSHPAIPRLYEFGRLRGVPFLVIELLSGRSLDGISKARSKPGVTEILAHASQALDALSMVHSRGIVHRDLKPSNLFLTDDGLLKVLDFGAAIDVDASSFAPDSLTSGLLGTPAYMPPEQARGRWDMVDRRSDIWSLGAVLFTLLSGEHVHPAQTPNEQLSFAMTRGARSLGDVVPELDRALVSVIDRALAYERGERFQTAEAFREALSNTSTQELRGPSDSLEVTARDTGSVSDPGQSPHRRAASRPILSAAWVGGACFSCCAMALVFLPAVPAVSVAPRGAVRDEHKNDKSVAASVRSLPSATPSNSALTVPTKPVSSVVNVDSERALNPRRADARDKLAIAHSPSRPAEGRVEAQARESSVDPALAPTQTPLNRRLRDVGEGPKTEDTRSPPRTAGSVVSPLDIRR